MARTNRTTTLPPIVTHEGAPAKRISTEAALRRSVLACMLWEDEFYESGKTIAERIKTLAAVVDPAFVAALAVEAREDMKLRHAPLWLVRALAQGSPEARTYVSTTLARVIQRPDEITEFLSLYWQDGKEPISAQVKKGLGQAFRKFSAYQLAKYNRDTAIKLRDAMFLVHPRPIDLEQAATWKQLAEGTLPIPDTWEVALSTGKDKRDTWIRLMAEGKLGGLALLRNLRNMLKAGVSESVIAMAVETMKTERILPFRFITAARHAPALEPSLEAAMYRSVSGVPRLPGKTILVIDVSGSMSSQLSAKSELTRVDTAAALGILLQEASESLRVYTTAGSDMTRVHRTEMIPSRRGFALADAVRRSMAGLGGGGIFLTPAMEYVYGLERRADRIIVITDEQDCAINPKDSPIHARPFGTRNYLINVASAKNGIGYGKWTHIDGFSEAVIDYIRASESEPTSEAETPAEV